MKVKKEAEAETKEQQKPAHQYANTRGKRTGDLHRLTHSTAKRLSLGASMSPWSLSLRKPSVYPTPGTTRCKLSSEGGRGKDKHWSETLQAIRASPRMHVRYTPSLPGSTAALSSYGLPPLLPRHRQAWKIGGKQSSRLNFRSLCLHYFLPSLPCRTPTLPNAQPSCFPCAPPTPVQGLDSQQECGIN